MSKRRRLGSLFLKLMFLIVFLPATGFAQGQERIIDKLSWRTEPIKILKLKTKGKIIELRKKFSEEDDWLKGLTFTVENISNKAIARIELDLAFPRPEGSSEEIGTYVVPMNYGLDPSDPAFTEEKLVLPGDSVEVKLLEVNLPFIKTDLENLSYPKRITHAQIRVDSVTFVDGTQWAGDVMLYPDPNNPMRKFNPQIPDLRQAPEVSKPPRTGRQFPGKSRLFGFLNASFSRAHAPAVMNGTKSSFANLWSIQDPTLPCNAVFVANQSHSCGPVGEGCTYTKPAFDNRIELMGLINARIGVSQARCEYSDGTLCAPNPIVIDSRLPCAARFAGCGGPLAPLRKRSAEDPSPMLADPYCCNPEASRECRDSGGEWSDLTCTCISPIVIDVAGNGFNLTNADNGVMFDIIGNGVADQISWTADNSDDAWLALDRNGNAMIDDGTELFGSSSPQPYLTPGESKNGFRALALFDRTDFGGNNDGQIDLRDAIFSSLKLWQDHNHNGVSEAEELQSLSTSVIRVIELRYRESRRHDENGNWFRYRAKVRDARGAQVGRWAWDVFLRKVH